MEKKKKKHNCIKPNKKHINTAFTILQFIENYKIKTTKLNPDVFFPLLRIICTAQRPLKWEIFMLKRCNTHPPQKPDDFFCLNWTRKISKINT